MKKTHNIGSSGFSVEEIALRIGCPFEGAGSQIITGIASLNNAGPGDLVFLSDLKYLDMLKKSEASAAILPSGIEFNRMPVIRSENPYLAFNEVIPFFYKAYRPDPGIHPQALISPSARIGKNVSIGPHTIIGDDVKIDENTLIYPLVNIYPRVNIGRDCVIHSNVSIREDTLIGDRVFIQNGAVIGSDGFRFVKDKDGTYKKIPQIGKVRIDDDVEIGANTAIDRAGLEETHIQKGTKIDNLVQIAHNVVIGPNSILAGQAGIAGSSKLGKNVILGGQVGIADHIEVGDDAVMAAKTGVTKNISSGDFVSGSPHLNIREWRKAWASIPRLYELLRDFRKLKKRLDELEKKINKNL